MVDFPDFDAEVGEGVEEEDEYWLSIPGIPEIENGEIREEMGKRFGREAIMDVNRVY